MKFGKVIYFGVLMAIIVFLAYMSKPYIVDYNKANKSENEVLKAKETKSNNKVDINFNKLHKINNDIIAWLHIPDTKIDYPVVKTKDNKFYLYHNIKKEANSYGSLFFDAREYNNPLKEKNIIVYGHNMGSFTNKMFSTLDDYLDISYLHNHKKVLLYTQKGLLEYEVIKVKEVYSNDKVFKIKFNNQEFDDWISSICTEKNLDQQIKQVLTLTTCNTSGSKRIVLQCIKL